MRTRKKVRIFIFSCYSTRLSKYTARCGRLRVKQVDLTIAKPFLQAMQLTSDASSRNVYSDGLRFPSGNFLSFVYH